MDAPQGDRAAGRASPLAARDLPGGRGVRLGWRLCGALLRAGWQVRVFGQEHVPEKGPVILAGNHTGVFDGPLLFGTSPRPPHVLTKREVFVGPVGSVLRGVGQIPLDRWNIDVRALLAALRALAGDRVVGVYPEGERSDGHFARVRDGLAYYALRTGALVVPVSTFGVVRPGQSTSRPPRLRSRVEVVYGAPFTVQAPEPWGPYLPRRLVSEASEGVRLRLLDHLRHACELTGHPVPESAHRHRRGHEHGHGHEQGEGQGRTPASGGLPEPADAPGEPGGQKRERGGEQPVADGDEGDGQLRAPGEGDRRNAAREPGDQSGDGAEETGERARGPRPGGPPDVERGGEVEAGEEAERQAEGDVDRGDEQLHVVRRKHG